MDLPCTESGNKHVVVFQDMFTKWPLVFAVPDQHAERIARLLCEEVIPMFGVPEALLSDRGANLLSHLMLDVCRLLGMEKINTTSYHPQCDGMVERFNRTLKSMLRKRAAQFGNQWDRHLPALLWAYRNAPYNATNEKPSFLLFGWDCRSPTEAALLPVSKDTHPTTIEDYREELVVTLTSARDTALESIHKAQRRYKGSYDRKSDHYTYHIGDWVMIRFPSEETGRLRKLSRPWHGPYRVTSCNATNVTAVKVYFPREDPIQVHQLRVKPCPPGFTAGFYWYGTKQRGPGRPPRWVCDILTGEESPATATDVGANPLASDSYGGGDVEGSPEGTPQLPAGDSPPVDSESESDERAAQAVPMPARDQADATRDSEVVRTTHEEGLSDPGVPSRGSHGVVFTEYTVEEPADTFPPSSKDGAAHRRGASHLQSACSRSEEHSRARYSMRQSRHPPTG